MITLRCTQKLLRLLDETPTGQPQPPTARLGDWYAKPVETVAGDLIVLMSETTYLSVGVPAIQAPMLEQIFQERVYNILRHLNVPPALAAEEMTHYRSVDFAKTASRSHLGVLNEIALYYQLYAERGLGRGVLLLSEAERVVVTGLFGKEYKTPVDEVYRLFGLDPLSYEDKQKLVED